MKTEKEETITTQLTAKRLKAHVFLAHLVIMMGAGLIFGGAAAIDPAISASGWWAMLGGFLWLFATRIRIWWNHE